MSTVRNWRDSSFWATQSTTLSLHPRLGTSRGSPTSCSYGASHWLQLSTVRWHLHLWPWPVRGGRCPWWWPSPWHRAGGCHTSHRADSPRCMAGHWQTQRLFLVPGTRQCIYCHYSYNNNFIVQFIEWKYILHFGGCIKTQYLSHGLTHIYIKKSK